MKNVIYLFGPTVMIFIGLSYLESIPMTFLLFYCWLFFIPLFTYIKHSSIKEAFVHSIKKRDDSKNFISWRNKWRYLFAFNIYLCRVGTRALI